MVESAFVRTQGYKKTTVRRALIRQRDRFSNSLIRLFVHTHTYLYMQVIVLEIHT